MELTRLPVLSRYICILAQAENEFSSVEASFFRFSSPFQRFPNYCMPSLYHFIFTVNEKM